MTDQIISKLKYQISEGLNTEPQVLYVLAEIRKMLERDHKNSQSYSNLKFYCDWVLHPRLTGDHAKSILELFEDPHYILSRNLNLPDSHSIYEILKLNTLKTELKNLFEPLGIENFTSNPDKWMRFASLFFHIVMDCPLQIIGENKNFLKEVGITIEEAKENAEIVFRVSWHSTDRSNLTVHHHIINSYSINNTTPNL